MTKYSVIDKKGNKVSEFEVMEEKEWPQHKDWFWYVDSTGEVYRDVWLNLRNDHDMKSFGNIFRTEEEALQARDKIKELLRSLKNGK